MVPLSLFWKSPTVYPFSTSSRANSTVAAVGTSSGELSRNNRSAPLSVKDPTEITLPLFYVKNIGDVLQPTKPIIPELWEEEVNIVKDIVEELRVGWLE